MRHFLRLAAGIDVMPLVHALSLKPELWNANPIRSEFPGSPHAQADDIWLLFNEIDLEKPATAIDDIRVVPYLAWKELPQARRLVLDLLRAVEGIQLGRVMITRLAPGKRITPHTDHGAPALYYRRYQIALQSYPGAQFHIGGETVNFRSGEAWWIDNRTEHSVENASSEDRIVMIVDVRSADD